jgi:hypothetical protein
MTNQYFDISRLSKFIVRQGTLYVNQMLLAVAVIFGILFTATVLVAYFSPENLPGIWFFYTGVYFIVGFVLTSAAFSELNSPHSGYAFLTLPVSSLEKLIGAWFITSIVYSLAYFLIVLAMYVVVGLIMPGTVLFDAIELGASNVANDPNIRTQPETVQIIQLAGFKTILSYLTMQPVFLIGASTFIKNNFLKTLLSVFLFWLGIGLYAALVFWMLFGNAKALQPGGDISQEMNDILEFAIKAITYVVLPLFLITVSYFKIKERQV